MLAVLNIPTEVLHHTINIKLIIPLSSEESFILCQIIKNGLLCKWVTNSTQSEVNDGDLKQTHIKNSLMTANKNYHLDNLPQFL